MSPRLTSKPGRRMSPASLPGAEVTCDYVEEKLTGTPKFNCALAPKDKVRVKYGAENGEVYSEVAASRLLWALGFGADRVFPVTVVCKDCPADPIKNHKKVAGTRTFAPAVIERKMPGDEIELFKDSGWDWVELTFVDQTVGGAPLAHRDALKLLAAFIQHTDNKPQQQRLACLDKQMGKTPSADGSCAHPFMLINDLGKTFGTATMFNTNTKSAVNLKEWSNTPVWKGDTGCVAQLSKSMTGSLEHPKIGEAGRRFLSELLVAAVGSAIARPLRGRTVYKARSVHNRRRLGCGVQEEAGRHRVPDVFVLITLVASAPFHALVTSETTSATPMLFVTCVKTNGPSPRILRASRSITLRSAPMSGARSVLLMMRRSDWVIPGPPFLGILSPPDTSMT